MSAYEYSVAAASIHTIFTSKPPSIRLYVLSYKLLALYNRPRTRRIFCPPPPHPTPSTCSHLHSVSCFINTTAYATYVREQAIIETNARARPQHRQQLIGASISVLPIRGSSQNHTDRRSQQTLALSSKKAGHPHTHLQNRREIKPPAEFKPQKTRLQHLSLKKQNSATPNGCTKTKTKK